ncbi:MAG: hypothetical protein R3B82_28435 [Sandaracinaceae bacterium]
MTWQDAAVFAIVAAALGFLVWKLWPQRRRPDVKASSLVRKRKEK